MTLDYYERHLLALAVQACGQRDHAIQMWPGNAMWDVWSIEALARDGTGSSGKGPTLADALTALLTDLGVQVPERPSEEAVWAWMRKHIFGGEVPLDELRRDPLLAAAVLEADTKTTRRSTP